MAKAVLSAFGIPIKLESLDAEIARLNSDPLFKLIKSQREKRSAGWLNYVGYTRGREVKSESVDDVEMANAELQRRIDRLRQQR